MLLSVCSRYLVTSFMIKQTGSIHILYFGQVIMSANLNMLEMVMSV